MLSCAMCRSLTFTLWLVLAYRLFHTFSIVQNLHILLPTYCFILFVICREYCIYIFSSVSPLSRDDRLQIDHFSTYFACCCNDQFISRVWYSDRNCKHVFCYCIALSVISLQETLSTMKCRLSNYFDQSKLQLCQQSMKNKIWSQLNLFLSKSKHSLNPLAKAA